MTNDFTGFSFDGIHSSLLNIVRVSDGDRYNESLQSDFEDKRKQILGRDGEYYYGSDYQARTISIKIAFDSMTEKQFRTMAYLFSNKKLCPLIFDERPYKMYMAKISSPIEMSYICFEEKEKIIPQNPSDGIRVIGRDNGEIQREQIYPYVRTQNISRVYKGEATIEFICPNPFARAPFKQLDLYSEQSIEGNVLTTYNTVNQWADASGILSRADYERNHLDIPFWNENNIQFKTYNPGDKDAPFYLYIPFITFNNNKVIGRNTGGNGALNINGQFRLSVDNQILIINSFKRKNKNKKSGLYDTGVIINTENHLIEGVNFDGGSDTWKTTGNIYNEYIVGGDFPVITHRGVHTLISNAGLMSSILSITCYVPQSDAGNIRLFYDYLYY